jgi:hypothetical protein
LVRKLINIVGSLKEEFTEDLNLSLLIGPDRFAYLVYSKNIWHVSKLSVFEFDNEREYLTQLQDFLEGDEIVLSEYSLLNLSIQHYDAFKNPELSDLNLNTAHWIKYQKELKSILQYFDNTLAQFIVKDSFKSMQLAFRKNYKNNNAIFSFWQKGKLFLWTFSDEKLDLKVAKEYKTTEDALYYVLSCFKISEFDTANHKLFIAGELSEDSLIYNLLYSYIANIQFLSNPTDLRLPEDPDAQNVHLFYDLLAAEI